MTFFVVKGIIAICSGYAIKHPTKPRKYRKREEWGTGSTSIITQIPFNVNA